MLRLTIHNGNRSPVVPTDGTGLGLVGMRERVEAVGGTLRHGPRPRRRVHRRRGAPLRQDR